MKSQKAVYLPGHRYLFDDAQLLESRSILRVRRVHDVPWDSASLEDGRRELPKLVFVHAATASEEWTMLTLPVRFRA